MTLKRRFFSAPTLTQALLAAARHHSATPDAIDYKVIDKKQGFIKAPRGVVIEVDPDAPTSALAPAAPVAPVVVDDAPHPALQAAVPAPAGRETEVSFEPAGGEEPAEHPGLTSVVQEAESIETAPEPATPAHDEESTDEPSGEQAASDDAFESNRAAEEPPPISDPPSTTAGPPGELEFEGVAEEEPAPTVVGGGLAEESAPAAAEAPVPETVTDAELQEAVAEAIDELAFLASLRVQVASVKSSDEGLDVELEGPDSPRLAARDGRALLAMQHLLPRLLFARLGKAVRCHLDCDNFHGARTERIERLAQKAAERVRSGGRSWLLEPMAPDERRLVHMALSEVPDIETESVGEGFLKRVRVAQIESA